MERSRISLGIFLVVLGLSWILVRLWLRRRRTRRNTLVIVHEYPNLGWDLLRLVWWAGPYSFIALGCYIVAMLL